MPTLLGEESQRHVAVSWSLFSLLFLVSVAAGIRLAVTRRDSETFDRYSHEPGHELDEFELQELFLALQPSQKRGLVCGPAADEESDLRVEGRRRSAAKAVGGARHSIMSAIYEMQQLHEPEPCYVACNDLPSPKNSLGCVVGVGRDGLSITSGTFRTTARACYGRCLLQMQTLDVPSSL